MVDVINFIGSSFKYLWQILFSTESPFGFSWGVLFSGMVALGIIIDIWVKILYNEGYQREYQRFRDRK